MRRRSIMPNSAKPGRRQDRSGGRKGPGVARPGPVLSRGNRRQARRKRTKSSEGLCRGERLDRRQDDDAEIWDKLAGPATTPSSPSTRSQKRCERTVPGKASGEDGGYEGAVGARLHEPARSHRREISHERSAAGGAQSRKEIRSGRRNHFRRQRVATSTAKLTIGRIEVDKSRQTVKAFDPSGALIAFFPATVGSKEKPTPSGTLKVVSADANPTYRYNPDYKFKGVKSKKPSRSSPGRTIRWDRTGSGCRRRDMASMARPILPRSARPNPMAAFG